MILMYCYGSAFHVNKLRLKKVTKAGVASPVRAQTSTVEKVTATETTYYLQIQRKPHHIFFVYSLLPMKGA